MGISLKKHSKSMYENYKLCDNLMSFEICIVVEQYREGGISRKFHEHIPWYRLSNERRTWLLRMLAFHFSGTNAQNILSNCLNGRAKSPPVSPLLCNVSYPEPDVFGTYFGGNTVAWSDQVIAPDKFRRRDADWRFDRAAPSGSCGPATSRPESA